MGVSYSLKHGDGVRLTDGDVGGVVRFRLRLRESVGDDDLPVTFLSETIDDGDAVQSEYRSSSGSPVFRYEVKWLVRRHRVTNIIASTISEHFFLFPV